MIQRIICMIFHWISVLLPCSPNDVVQFLVNVSFEATKDKRKSRRATK